MYLGSCIRPDHINNLFVEGKVKSWSAELEVLATTAIKLILFLFTEPSICLSHTKLKTIASYIRHFMKLVSLFCNCIVQLHIINFVQLNYYYLWYVLNACHCNCTNDASLIQIAGIPITNESEYINCKPVMSTLVYSYEVPL